METTNNTQNIVNNLVLRGHSVYEIKVYHSNGTRMCNITKWEIVFCLGSVFNSPNYTKMKKVLISKSWLQCLKISQYNSFLKLPEVLVLSCFHWPETTQQLLSTYINFIIYVRNALIKIVKIGPHWHIQRGGDPPLNFCLQNFVKKVEIGEKNLQNSGFAPPPELIPEYAAVSCQYLFI